MTSKVDFRLFYQYVVVAGLEGEPAQDSSRSEWQLLLKINRLQGGWGGAT